MKREELSGAWSLDPIHTRIGFNTRHAMVTKVRGAFNDVVGEAHLNLDDMGKSWAEVAVDVGSIDTRNPDRDEHLRGADFFDVENYPTMTFTSTSIDEVDDSSFIVVGELTIKDVTKQISIPLGLTGIDTDHFGQMRAGLEGSRRINRQEWDVRWNAQLDSGGFLISDRVVLEFELSLIKQVDQPEEELADSDSDA